jgi:hypothetical protein
MSRGVLSQHRGLIAAGVLVVVLGALSTLAAAWGWAVLPLLPHSMVDPGPVEEGWRTWRSSMGFPMTCFDGDVHHKHMTRPDGSLSIQTRPDGCYQVLRRVSLSEIRVISLAYRPRFPGIVVNMLFWCGVWGVIVWGVSRVPGYVRRRRGQCAGCGYDRAGMGGACPECGRAAAV